MRENSEKRECGEEEEVVCEEESEEEVEVVCEEEEEEVVEGGWWDGEDAKTLEEEAREKNITNLFDPELLGKCYYALHISFIMFY